MNHTINTKPIQPGPSRAFHSKTAFFATGPTTAKTPPVPTRSTSASERSSKPMGKWRTIKRTSFHSSVQLWPCKHAAYALISTRSTKLGLVYDLKLSTCNCRSTRKLVSRLTSDLPRILDFCSTTFLSSEISNLQKAVPRRPMKKRSARSHTEVSTLPLSGVYSTYESDAHSFLASLNSKLITKAATRPRT